MTWDERVHSRHAQGTEPAWPLPAARCPLRGRLPAAVSRRGSDPRCGRSGRRCSLPVSYGSGAGSDAPVPSPSHHGELGGTGGDGDAGKRKGERGAASPVAEQPLRGSGPGWRLPRGTSEASAPSIPPPGTLAGRRAGMARTCGRDAEAHSPSHRGRPHSKPRCRGRAAGRGHGAAELGSPPPPGRPAHRPGSPGVRLTTHRATSQADTHLRVVFGCEVAAP